MPEAELVKLAAELQPLVLINRSSDPTPAASLSIDYRAGIRKLARHLHELGHRRLVFVEGPAGSRSNSSRILGLEEFRDAAPDVAVERVPGGAAIEDGFAAARAVRDSGATAALAFNDLVAVGLVNGLAQLGVRVPEDLSVTGFDDIPFARYFSPPLTTASVPHAQLGAEAWRRLGALINHEEPGAETVLQPGIEVRGSTARLTPPAARAGAAG